MLENLKSPFSILVSNFCPKFGMKKLVYIPLYNALVPLVNELPGPKISAKGAEMISELFAPLKEFPAPLAAEASNCTLRIVGICDWGSLV